MKKLLLATLLASLCGLGIAQSSVTIYGKIDLGLTKSNSGKSTLSGATGPLDSWGVEPGAASRLGFRGTEDLGGGLRVNFMLETRFNPDTGQQQAAEIFRHSWIELQGQFGEVRVGRDFTPAFRVAFAGDPFEYDTVAQAGPAHVLLGLSPVRFSNMVQYKTPNIAGVTALVGVAPTEGVGLQPGGNGGTAKPLAANVVYQRGALYAGVAYENAGAQSTLGAKTHLSVLTVSYDLGFFKPIFLYGKGSAYAASGARIADRTNTQIGGLVPAGTGTIKLLLARRHDRLTDIAINKVGLGYHHPLSKRTKLYVDVGSAKETNRERRTAFDLGIQHNF